MMKSIISFFLIFLCLLLYSCDSHDYNTKQTKAIDTCYKYGGIPIFDGWGKMSKCDFPPQIKKEEKEKNFLL